MTFSQKIADGLTLRSLKDDADKARFATFSTVYNNASEGATCACLTQYHPEMTPDDFWIIESDAAREIVSTTCLKTRRLPPVGCTLHAVLGCEL
jgi:hypothetical protein